VFVEEATIARLIDLNRQFYQQFAAPFSATRRRIQPGVNRILGRLPTDGHLLDLGCGNGNLAWSLAQRGFSGSYLGLDFSAELLPQEDAFWTQSLRSGGRVAAQTGKPQISFLVRDLSSPDWSDDLPPATYDTVLAFAVLHHLPGRELRLSALRQVRRLLSPNGHFYHSHWQFRNSPRLVGRILPWELAGLSASDVDEGDALLDWRRLEGGSTAGQQPGIGMRYVHQYSIAELEDLAAASGFQILETFVSDGAEGNLGLYQLWQTA
jgi:tRNA (uracil-5-)-methyltransferase TRM9